MTNEEKGKTEKWVASKRVKHAYGYDSDSKLMRHFGIRGIPHAVLVDAAGTVVWRGHPGQLSDDVVEGALVGALAVPVWDWPEAAAPARTALAEGRYADALDLAKKLGDGGAPIAKGIQGMVDGRMASLRAAAGSGDVLRTFGLAKSAKMDFAGLPVAEEAARILKKIEDDPDSAGIMEGQKALAQIGTQNPRTRKDAERLIARLESLARAHPDTIVSQGAQEMILQLRGMSRRLR